MILDHASLTVLKLTRPSFVVSLESEIRRLQKQIAARKGSNVNVVEPGPAQQREASDVESLVSDFGFLFASLDPSVRMRRE